MKQRFLLTLGVLAMLSCGSPAGRTVTLSNVSLPKDTAGNDLITGEASVLSWGGAYYVYFNDWGSCPGVDCCPSFFACAGGSNVLVYTADHPLGPFTFQSDAGSNASPFNIHVPDHYVTGAQGTDVIRVPGADGSLQFLWVGNQWVTAGGPGHPRDHDLLYWSVLQFDNDGRIQHFVHQDAITLSLQ